MWCCWPPFCCTRRSTGEKYRSWANRQAYGSLTPWTGFCSSRSATRSCQDCCLRASVPLGSNDNHFNILELLQGAFDAFKLNVKVQQVVNRRKVRLETMRNQYRQEKERKMRGVLCVNSMWQRAELGVAVQRLEAQKDMMLSMMSDTQKMLR